MCVILGVRQVPSTISRVYGGWELGEGVPCSVSRVMAISLSIIGIFQTANMVSGRYRCVCMTD